MPHPDPRLKNRSSQSPADSFKKEKIAKGITKKKKESVGEKDKPVFKPHKLSVSAPVEAIKDEDLQQLDIKSQIQELNKQQQRLTERVNTNSKRIVSNSREANKFKIRIENVPPREPDRNLDSIVEDIVDNTLRVPKKRQGPKFGIKDYVRTGEGRVIVITVENEYTKRTIFEHARNLGSYTYQDRTLRVNPERTPEEQEKNQKALILRRLMMESGFGKVKVIGTDWIAIADQPKMRYNEALEKYKAKKKGQAKNTANKENDQDINIDDI